MFWIQKTNNKKTHYRWRPHENFCHKLFVFCGEKNDFIKCILQTMFTVIKQWFHKI